MATYYTATTGNDGNAGTIGSPFLTIGHGISVLVAGDELLVRTGTYNEALSSWPANGTSWSNKIRIAAYPGEVVTLDAGSANFALDWNQNEKYIEIDGINLDASSCILGIINVEPVAPPNPRNPHHIRVQNCSAEGNDDPAQWAHNITCKGGFNGAVGFNEFINILLFCGGNSDFEHGFYIKSSDNLIDGCEVYNYVGGGIHLYNSEWGMYRNVIRNNLVRDGRLAVYQGGAGRHWGIITANGSFDTDIYNNVVYGTRQENSVSAGIYIWVGGNTRVFNNTIVDNEGEGIVIDSSSVDALVQNNIAWDNARGNFRDNGYRTVINNNWFDRDPLFVNQAGNDYNLQTGSPALGWGATDVRITTDISGNPRPPGSNDPGAHTGPVDEGEVFVDDGTRSALRTVKLRNFPSAADSTAVPDTASASVWDWSAWVEILPATAASLQVAGLQVQWNGFPSNARVLIQMGIGAAAAETDVFTWYFYLGNVGSSSANSGPDHHLLPVPVDLFPIGSRISVRWAHNGSAGSNEIQVAMLHYQGLDSSNVIEREFTHYPLPTIGDTSAANGRVAVTPSATPWADSAWVKLSPNGGFSDAVGLGQVSFDFSLANVAFEVDIGTGASGSQVVITTFGDRQADDDGGQPSWLDFPGLYPIPAGTEVWGRLRKAGTSATVQYLSLNYYDAWIPTILGDQYITQTFVEIATDEDLDADPPETPAECDGGGDVASGTNPADGTALATATKPLAWMELTVGATTYSFAGIGIPHGSHKKGRILSFGTASRALSDSDGVPEAASMSILLSDTDLVLRGLRNSGTLRHALVDVFIADLATLKASGTPWRVFRGLVVDGQPEADLQFRLELEDVFSARLNSIDSEDLRVPRQLVDEDLGDLDTTDEMFGKAVPLIYGRLSRVGGAWECKYVGNAVAPGQEDLGALSWFLVGLGALQIRTVFAGRLTASEPRDRVQITDSLFGQTIFSPSHDGWIEPDNWSERGGRRYTLIAGKPTSPAIRQAAEGRIPLVVEVCGFDTVGDRATSPVTTITSPARALLHFLNNFVLQEATADWLPIASFGDYSLLDSQTFETVHDYTEAQLSGAGYQCDGVIADDFDQTAWRDAVATFCRSFGFDIGINRHGQMVLTILDRSDAASSASAFTVANILKNSVRTDARASAVENEVRYVFERNYLSTLPDPTPPQETRLPNDPFSGKWHSGLLSVRNETSITALGGDPTGVRRSEVQELGMVRDEATAEAVANERLDLLSPANGRAEVTFDLSLRHAAALELGDIVTLEHWDAPWSGSRRCQIRRLETDIDQLKVTVTARDVHDLLP